MQFHDKVRKSHKPHPPAAELCVELVSGSDTVTKGGAGWLLPRGDCDCRSIADVDALEEVGEGDGRGMPGTEEATVTDKSQSFSFDSLLGLLLYAPVRTENSSYKQDTHPSSSTKTDSESKTT